MMHQNKIPSIWKRQILHCHNLYCPCCHDCPKVPWIDGQGSIHGHHAYFVRIPESNIDVREEDTTQHRGSISENSVGIDYNSEFIFSAIDVDENSKTLDNIIPEIPSIILGTVIAPFIADRPTYNNFRLVSKEVYNLCTETTIPPWPDTILKGHIPLWSVAFSPDGSVLAAGGSDGKIRLWDRRRGPLYPLTGHLGRVYAIDFSPDGTMMISGSGDGDVRVWNMKDFTCETLNPNTPHIDSLVFNKANGDLIASSGDGTIKLWDIPSKRCISVLTEQNRVVEAVAFSPDGAILASGTWGNQIHLWDIESGKCLTTYNLRSNVHSIAYSPDGTHLVSGSGDRSIRVYSLANGDYYTLDGHQDSVWSVCFSPDGKYIGSGSDDGTVRIWCRKSGRCRAISSCPGRKSAYSVTFSPDGLMLASAGSDGSIHLRKL